MHDISFLCDICTLNLLHVIGSIDDSLIKFAIEWIC